MRENPLERPGYTRFCATYDSQHRSLALIVGEQLVDVDELHVTRAKAGGYECSIVRAGAGRLVASGSPQGRAARQAGRARASATPGFVEVTTQGEAAGDLRRAVAAYFGQPQEDGAEQEAVSPSEEPALDLKKATQDIENYFHPEENQ